MKYFSLILTVLCLGALFSAMPAGAGVGHPWDGSKVVPHHRIPVSDETGRFIHSGAPLPKPISMRQTCGVCHDYDMISGGTHFNSTDPDASHGRDFEPWFLVDEATGTQMPVSYRGQQGTWDPADAGLTSWTFTLNFGRHHPGGDMAEPDDIYDPTGRWPLAGRLEINCLVCHNDSPRQDMAEWAKQIGRQNFKWAATAASGMAEVRGMVSRLPDSFNIDRGFNPDDSQYAVPPLVRYDSSNFDTKQQAYFEIAQRPADQRCLHCHSFQKVDQERWMTDADVHTRAGMSCADCHRHGLDHNIVRGYEGEAASTGRPEAEGLSCAGCHEGVRNPDRVSVMGGRMGAPMPEHKGIPQIHFEKMTCTSCHSGIWPEDGLARMRTSRANRLGIAGQAVWMTDAPYIVEPVFKRNEQGKIAPYRMMWPAFWAAVEGDEVTPLTPEEVSATAGALLASEQRIGQILKAFDLVQQASGNPGVPVLAMGDKVYRSNVDGMLEVYENTSTFQPEHPTWAVDRDGDITSMLPYFTDVVLFTNESMMDSLVNHFKALELHLPDHGAPVYTSGTTAYLIDVNYEIIALGIDPVEYPNWGWLDNETGNVDMFFDDLTTQTIAATASQEQKLTEDVVAAVLERLTQKAADNGTSATYGYVSSGRLFTMDDDGTLVASEHAAAEPVAWPIAHNVRGAGQSMGARRCEDCHASDAPFYFAGVTAFGPLQTDKSAVAIMKDLMGEGEKVYENVSKVFTWFIIITMTLLILHIIADFARRTFLKPKASE